MGFRCPVAQNLPVNSFPFSGCGPADSRGGRCVLFSMISMVVFTYRASLADLLPLCRLRSSGCIKAKGDDLTEIQDTDTFQHMSGTK